MYIICTHMYACICLHIYVYILCLLAKQPMRELLYCVFRLLVYAPNYGDRFEIHYQCSFDNYFKQTASLS